MKYLITIISLICALSLATLVIIWPNDSPDEKDVVLTVNDSKMTSTMIEKSKNRRSSHHEGATEFLNSIIIEQLLIQEAQRQKIDQEAEFRDAIKIFYEQSLIKVLLDRKNKQIGDDVSDTEVDAFFSYFGKAITFSIAQGSGTRINPEIDWGISTTQTKLFDDLSMTLQPILVGLQPGNTRTVYDTDNEWFAVRVDDITEGNSHEEPDITREKVQSVIASHKRGQQLNMWVNTLISDANISMKKEKD